MNLSALRFTGHNPYPVHFDAKPMVSNNDKRLRGKAKKTGTIGRKPVRCQQRVNTSKPDSRSVAFDICGPPRTPKISGVSPSTKCPSLDPWVDARGRDTDEIGQQDISWLEARQTLLTEPDWAGLELSFIPALRHRPTRLPPNYVPPRVSEPIPIEQTTISVTVSRPILQRITESPSKSVISDVRESNIVDNDQPMRFKSPATSPSQVSETTHESILEEEDYLWQPDPRLSLPISFPRNPVDSDDDPFHIMSLLGTRKRKRTIRSISGKSPNHSVVSSARDRSCDRSIDTSRRSGTHIMERHKTEQQQQQLHTSWDEVEFFSPGRDPPTSSVGENTALQKDEIISFSSSTLTDTFAQPLISREELFQGVLIRDIAPHSSFSRT